MKKDDYFLWLNEKIEVDKRLSELKQYAIKNDVPIIQDEGIVFLKHLIDLTNSKKILEIGTAIGYSAIQLALINPDIRITTIERDEQMVNIARKNFEVFNLQEQIKLIHMDALDLELDSLESNYDLIFIDAAKSQYQKFFEKYTQLLKTGGVVVTDNLIFHELIFEDEIKNRNTRQLINKIKKYNQWLKENQSFNTYFYPIGDGISVSIKK